MTPEVEHVAFALLNPYLSSFHLWRQLEITLVEAIKVRLFADKIIAEGITQGWIKDPEDLSWLETPTGEYR